MSTITTPTEPATDPAPAADSPIEPANNDHLVPVSEAIRYRKRAQTAEQQLENLQGELGEAQQQLDTARHTIDALERRQRIDALLTESDVIDLDVARLLTDAAVHTMDEPDVELAVDELQRSKPYLFGSRPSGAAASAMPARTDDPPHAVQQAADQAVTTGHRRDLLRYLRLRRTNQN